ncbi:cytochrome P450 [Vibrio vulnificus]|uniref:cytochrome P450 n=1 Tax=Vibrio vulnificus TaxID=672 RepID=UPI001CDD0206|nr:cytochrome P450 [Vibrio vulnificus]MCA3928087.1 cytochrome P450 [Vibrio vulnificus]
MFDFNPLCYDHIRNPYQNYDYLRDNHPVYWSNRLKGWVLTRQCDCLEVLKNAETFTRDKRKVGYLIDSQYDNLQIIEGEIKSTLHKKIVDGILSQNLENICTKNIEYFSSIFASKRDQGDINFVSEFSHPVSFKIASELLGISQSNWESFYPIFVGFTRGQDVALEPGRSRDAAEAHEKFSMFVEDWINKSNSGLIGYLKQHINSEFYMHPIVKNTIGAVFNASYSSLQSIMSESLLALKQQPSFLNEINSNVKLTMAANELIRFVNPAQGTARWALKDTNFRGVQIEAGTAVYTMLAAANRDPDAFSEPNILTLDRNIRKKSGKQMSFGAGIHACVGSRLALCWAEQLLKFWVDHLEQIEITSEPTYMDTATFRNITKLPVNINKG